MLPGAAAAHSGPAVDASAAGDPLALALVITAAAAYVVGARRLRARGGSYRGAREAAFLAGCAAVAVGSVEPVHGWAHRSLSGHMVQHLLLIVVAAPLFALARPAAALLWSLPQPARRRAGRLPRALASAGASTSGLLVAGSLHAAVLVAWHLPGPYGAALERPSLHRLEHATLLLSATVVWWGLTVAWRRGGAACVPAIGGATLGMTACGVLGLAMMFSSRPWYDAHVEALADQQIAGSLMWGPGGLVYAVAISALGLRLARPGAMGGSRTA